MKSASTNSIESIYTLPWNNGVYIIGETHCYDTMGLNCNILRLPCVHCCMKGTVVCQL